MLSRPVSPNDFRKALNDSRIIVQQSCDNYFFDHIKSIVGYKLSYIVHILAPYSVTCWKLGSVLDD
jgi:hypothetical protein